jgi:hypothetical protein
MNENGDTMRKLFFLAPWKVSVFSIAKGKQSLLPWREN